MSRARLAVSILLWLVPLGCATTASERPDEATEASAPHLPAPESYLGDPPLAFVRLSPDGESLAGLASSGFLIRKALQGSEILRLGQYDQPGRVVRDVGWPGEGIVAVVVEDLSAAAKGGARRVHLEAFRIERWHASRVGEGFSFDLPPGLPAEDAVLHWLPEDPDHVLVTEWEPGASGARVRRVRVADGLGTEVAPASLGAVRWFADADGTVRAARVRDPEGLTETVYARSDASAAFEPLVADDLIEESALAFAGFAPDPRQIYVTAPDEGGRSSLYVYDLAAQRRGARVASGSAGGIGRLVHEPDSDRLRAVGISPDSPTLQMLDPVAAGEEASLEATFPGRSHRLVSADLTGRVAILEVSGAAQPPEYFVYDREARQLDFLFAAHAELDPDRLAPVRAVQFAAREGGEASAALTVPRGLAPRSLPVVVLARSAACAHEPWAWDAVAQLLASRGFAVFQPIPRDGEEGALEEALADGVAWLVAEGVADPDRIGVYGAGAGGDAVLLSLVESPDRFHAAASYGAVTDWVSLREAPVRLSGLEPSQSALDAARDRERWAAISPALHVEAIRAPVLLGQGELDARVPVGQAERMASALEAAGGEVELQLYHDEADPFTDARHRVDFHQRLIAFFRRHLGDRAPL